MNEPKLIRRTSITNAAIMKQKKYLVIAILCVVTLILGSSYALLTNFDQTEEVITFKTGNLNITVNNALVTLNGNLPENDTTGLQNATPITLTLTNTGTMFIEEYDVKLVSDLNKNSTLKEDYIKYAISEDGISYSKPKILTSDENIIFSGYELEIDESKTIYLKVWIDEASGNQSLGKEYYGSIQINLYQKKEVPSAKIINAAYDKALITSCNPIVEEDGIIYFSGTNDCVDFNYVWYSGKLWRITAINPDGTMKMITDDNITSIVYGEDSIFYTNESTNSFVYQWLNQDFLDTLYNYENIIVTDATWNVTDSNASSLDDISKVLEKTKMVSAKVGLLNSYEYYLSYKNTSFESGYLNIRYEWWLSNPYNSASTPYVWNVSAGGSVYDCTSWFSGLGVRPVVNLKSTIQLAGGTGKKTDPYMLKGDKEDAIPNTTLLNTRSSGEYVNFDGELYRIVGIENDTTKVNKVDYVRDESDTVITKYLASSTTFGLDTNTQTEDYWDYYLNNTWYNSISSTYKSMIEKGTYYLGTVYESAKNYKLAICATVSNTVSTKDCTKTSTTYSGYVGLPRYGEMFASQQGSGYHMSSDIWLITPYSTSAVWYLYRGEFGSAVNSSSYAYGVRPSINLKSEIVIKSGSGTKEDPFIVGLPS